MATCAQEFKRFSASQKLTIITAILKGESLDIENGTSIGMYKQHFMLHDEQKHHINNTFSQGIFKLVWFLQSTSWVKYMKSLSLIQVYYGEKHAVYLTFLLHHIAMLIVPTILGCLLFAYQVYSSVQNYNEEKGWLQTYFTEADTHYNLIYQLFVAVWCSFYVESWKRK